MHGGVHGRQFRPMLYSKPDGLIAHRFHEVRFPVPLQARWIEPVEQALQRRVGQGADQIQCRFEKAAGRLQRLRSLARPAAVAPHNGAHLAHVQVFRKYRDRGNREEGKKPAQLLRRLRDEFAIPLQYGLGLIHLPKHRPGIDCLDGMRAELERGHHTKITAPAADGPEQVFVLFSAGGDETAVGQHHVRREQVVNRQSEPARQVSDAAAERQAGDASGGNGSGGHGQPERVGGVVHFPPNASASDAHALRLGVHPHVAHRGQINDQPVVANSQAAGIVAAASDGSEQMTLATEFHCGHHIGYIGAPRDQQRPLVDHAVIDFAGFPVSGIVAPDQLSAQLGFELINLCLSGHACLPAIFGLESAVGNKVSGTPADFKGRRTVSGLTSVDR